MAFLISNLLLESICDFGKGSNWKSAKTPYPVAHLPLPFRSLCFPSAAPLPLFLDFFFGGGGGIFQDKDNPITDNHNKDKHNKDHHNINEHNKGIHSKDNNDKDNNEKDNNEKDNNNTYNKDKENQKKTTKVSIIN